MPFTQLMTMRMLNNEIGDNDYREPGNRPNLALPTHTQDPDRQQVNHDSQWKTLPNIRNLTPKGGRFVQQLATISTPRNLRLLMNLKARLEAPDS